MSCTVLISPPWEELFFDVLWSSIGPPLPWSLSHTGIALGIPIALEDAGGDLATRAEICLKFVCSSNLLGLVKVLNISTGFLS